MKRWILSRMAFVLAGLAVALPVAAEAQRGAQRRADLAEMVAGTYHGDVISDARGSSRSGVTIMVARVGPNLVEVRSDYSRIPTVRIPLAQAMNAILSNSAQYTFLIQRDRDPNALSLTIDDASLSVRRR
jgi:hypothetical protein